MSDEDKFLPPMQELSIPKEDFLYMRMLANRCGIDITNYKKQAVYNRLLRRIHALKLADFDAYCRLLRMDIEEELKFINIITNSTTYFFREPHHFKSLASILTNALNARNPKFRIWSAGCSTGEEAYSIAMTIFSAIPDVEMYDIKVLATDVNSDALAIAKNGVYDRIALDNLTQEQQLRWTTVSPDGKSIKMNSQLKKILHFQCYNFLNACPFTTEFDVIFCRNVLIYFKDEITKQVLHKFHEHLKIKGTLILGYSENLKDLRELYAIEGKTTFTRLR